MVEVEPEKIVDREGHMATNEACQGGSMTNNESLVDSARFRRSERLLSILGKLRESRNDECSRGHSGHSFGGASVDSNLDQAGGLEAEARTDENLYENQRFVVDNGVREGPIEDGGRTREHQIRGQINLAVLDIMDGKKGDDYKKAALSYSDGQSTREATSQSQTTNKSDLKVFTIDNTIVDGNRNASPRSPRKTMTSPKDGSNASPRNPISFFDPNSDSSGSDSSVDHRKSVERKSGNTKKPARDKNAKKVSSKAKSVQSKSLSSDDSERDSMTSSSSSTGDSVSLSSEDGSSTASSLKKWNKLTIDTEDKAGSEPKVTSPIAEQASEFISKLVRHLQLHQTFVAPSKITRDDAKTKGRQRHAINAARSGEDEGTNSIIETGDRRKVPIVKGPPSPSKRGIMDELREKLAARALKIEASAMRDGHAVEEPTSAMPKEEPYAETFACLGSTDTGFQTERNTSGACGPFMACFEDNVETKKVKWQEGDESPFVGETSDLGKFWSTSTTKQKNFSRSVAENLEIEEMSMSVSSDSEDTWEQWPSTRDNDCTSLAYSLETEGAGEPKISPSGSDDSSMVPLRHGERERARPSMASQDPKSSSDELVIALSLSGESNNLISSPQNIKTPVGRYISTDDTREKAHERMTTKNNTFHCVHQRDRHREELMAKIQEFHQRKVQRENNGENFVDEPLSTKNVKRLPVRTSDELPIASKKIAEAYVNALSKKKEDNLWPKVVPTKVPGMDTMGFQTDFISMKPVPTDLSDDVIPVPENEAIRKTQQIHSSTINMRDSFSSEIGRSSTKTNMTFSANPVQDSGINLGDLVSRIDTVVQRLVQSGKIGTNNDPSQGTDLEKNNTSELLQNLAILRARRESGSSRTLRASSLYGFSASNVVDVPRSIPVKPSTPITPIQESQSIPPLRGLPQGETSNLDRLRAKRDQAARNVRSRAQRLHSMSRDTSFHGHEENPVIVENLTPNTDSTPQMNDIGRSFSSAKTNGPPRPESFSTRAGGGEVVPRRQMQILRVKDRLDEGDRRATSAILKTLSKPSKYDSMASWEQEQLKELPVLLQTTSSGNPENFSFQESSSNLSTGIKHPTSDSSPAFFIEEVDDETEAYGSDDGSEQMDRIEKMVQELRARKMRL